MEIAVKKAEDRETLARCLRVRREVFTVERGVSPAVEVDGDDRLDGPCGHFLILAGGEDAGAFRLRREGDRAVLQRFCLLPACRGKGWGRAAVERMEAVCRAQGVRRAALDAKFEVEGFYRACGYRTVSEPFMEAGIPHVRMEKTL